MIGDALNFPRSHIDAYLRGELGGSQDDAAGDRLIFIDGDKLDPVSFQLNAVTLLLINIEEERVLRDADAHVRQAETSVRRVLRAKDDRPRARRHRSAIERGSIASYSKESITMRL